MASQNPVDIAVSCDGINALVRAIRAEADGKELRKELAKNLRDALKPAAVQAKSGIMSMGSSGVGPGSAPALRSSIAKKIRPEVKLGGRWTGAKVKARKTPTIRGFANAAKRTQSDTWRTQSWGNGVWRNQPGKLDWFDSATTAHKAEYKQAVFEALEDMARRIANRS